MKNSSNYTQPRLTKTKVRPNRYIYYTFEGLLIKGGVIRLGHFAQKLCLTHVDLPD